MEEVDNAEIAACAVAYTHTRHFVENSKSWTSRYGMHSCCGRYRGLSSSLTVHVYRVHLFIFLLIYICGHIYIYINIYNIKTS